MKSPATMAGPRRMRLCRPLHSFAITAGLADGGTSAHCAGRSIDERRADDNTGERVGKGALAGAGVGTLFGLAALLIPGVGPFVTAGVLASALGATGGAIASGAIVGGTSGALAGAFSKAGYSRDEAEFYGSGVERGGVVVAVEADDVSSERLRSELAQFGGRTYGAEQTTPRPESRPTI